MTPKAKEQIGQIGYQYSDKSLRDVFDVSEVKELIEHAEKMAYDPLGILVVKDDLDGLMALRGEQSEIIDYLKEKKAIRPLAKMMKPFSRHS